MATIKDIKKWEQGEYTNIEYYRFRDNNCKYIHSDNLISYDNEVKDNYKVKICDLAKSADEYNDLIYSNTSEDANYWWNEGNKYLIVVLDWDFYNDCPKTE